MSDTLRRARFLPSDTTKELNNQDLQIDNFALALNKANYLGFSGKEKSSKIKDIALKYNSQFENSSNFFETIIERQENVIKGLNLESRSFSFSPDWRMVVGLGSESVYETSMTLHHIYGIPYLPGQAIKGVVRNWMINELFEGEEDKADTDCGFSRIFGKLSSGEDKAQKGAVIFFDAFPKTNLKIVPDVMNPHYSEYYSGQAAPADYLNPNPIPFLTIRDTVFKFFIGVRADANIPLHIAGGQGKLHTELEGRTPLEIVGAWLAKSLKEHGIGAKTAVGYGEMNEVLDQS